MDFVRIKNGYKHFRLQTLLRWLGRRGADQRVQIIGKVVGWSLGVPKSLPCGGDRSLGLDFHRSFFRAFFWRRFFSISLFFGRFWEVFGSDSGRQHRFLRSFFAMLFSSAFWYRFWVVLRRLEMWKIAIFLWKNIDFEKIGVFEKVVRKGRFFFRRSKQPKIEEKWCWKIFWTSSFKRFFRILTILPRFWEARGAPKIKKKKKIKKFGFGARLIFLIDFSSDFGTILGDLGWIWGGFWKDFGKIFGRNWEEKQWLGRPRESRWMDGWRRPNHMRSHLDAQQSPTPVNFRRFPGEAHGVAKQALF